MKHLFISAILFLTGQLASAQVSLESLFRGGSVTIIEQGHSRTEKLINFSDLSNFSSNFKQVKYNLEIFIPKENCEQFNSISLGVVYDQDMFFLNNVLVAATGDFSTQRRMVNTSRNYVLSPQLVQCGKVNLATLEVKRIIGSRIGPVWGNITVGPFSKSEKQAIYTDAFQGLHKEISIFLFSLALILFGLFKGHKDFSYLFRLGIFSTFGALLSITLSGWLYYFVDSSSYIYKINALVALGTILTFLYYLATAFEVKMKHRNVIYDVLVCQSIASVVIIFSTQESSTMLFYYKIILVLLICEVALALYITVPKKIALNRKIEAVCEIFIFLGMTSDILRIYNFHQLPNISTYIIAVGIGVIAVTAVSKLIDEINQAQQTQLTNKLAGVARQVAHDIRSPLSALNMVAAGLHEVSEEKRTILRNVAQRINDIANNLLKQSNPIADSLGTTASAPTFDQEKPSDLTMIAITVDAIVSEKRLQYRDRMDLEIIFKSEKAYGTFAYVNPSVLSRMLSNLIDNSADATPGGGRISIFLDSNESEIKIICSDNGRGVPPEILKKIGTPGLTYGKNGQGHGLGIPYVKSAIEFYGGKLDFRSNSGNGTVVTLTLPKAEAPSWFVENLNLKKNQLVVSIDDDQTVHQIWAERLSERPVNTNIQHLSFSKTEAAEDFLGSLTSEQRSEVLLLVDFEFNGKLTDGLDFIERNGCSKQAILVTSRFDDALVRHRSQKLGVRVIPKGLSPLVPFEYK